MGKYNLKSKRMASLLEGAKVFNKAGEADDLKDYTTVGLYFTAYWCPPCRGFTPTFNNAYKEAVAAGKSVQLVFMSCDQDQASYDSYYEKMDFARLDFSEKAKNQELAQKFGCSGIPYLVLLNADGSEKSRDGRGLVSSKGGNAFD